MVFTEIIRKAIFVKEISMSIKPRAEKIMKYVLKEKEDLCRFKIKLKKKRTEGMKSLNNYNLDSPTY